MGEQGRRPFGVGIAVAPTRLTAATVRERACAVHVDVPDGLVGADPATLVEHFRQLRRRLMDAVDVPVRSRKMNIALLPPFAETRMIALPPLRAGEAAAVIAREPRKYFVAVPESPVIAALDRPRGSHAPVLAALAFAPFVDAVRTAAIAAGWPIRDVVPAHSAWLAAARADGAGSVAAILDNAIHVSTLTPGGVPISLRRFPAAAVEEAAAALDANRILVLGGDRELCAALAANHRTHVTDRTEGARPREPLDLGSTRAPSAAFPPDAEVTAARFASAALPSFDTSAITGAHRDQRRRIVLRLTAAAAILLIVAAGLELWGVRRELTIVRARRAAIEASVAPLLELHDSLGAVEDRRAALREVIANTRSIMPALYGVATRLPPGASLTRFRIQTDTLTLDAVGAGAAEVLEALRADPALTDVRLEGQVERELRGGTTASERFTLVARVAASAESTESASGGTVALKPAAAPPDAGAPRFAEAQ